jgi:hypothetical protein
VPAAVELSSGLLVVFEPGGTVGLASQRHGGASVAAAGSSMTAWSILAHAGLEILGFGGGQARSCLRHQSLGIVAVSARRR